MLMLAALAISMQLSPDMTLWNVLQFVTIPGWVGVGVVTPLPVDVVVLVMVEEEVGGGIPKFCSIQYESPTMIGQLAAEREGFCRLELVIRSN